MIALLARERLALGALAPAALAEAVAGALAAARGSAPAERAGVWLATGDLGADAATALWAEAVEHGPGFASPALFPWTLASALAAHLARRLELRGPNATLVGGVEASRAALGFALDALEDGEIERALVLRVEARAGEVSALILGEGPGPRLRRTDAAVGLDLDPVSALAGAPDPVGLSLALPPWGSVRLAADPAAQGA